jgi:hypothetical protein
LGDVGFSVGIDCGDLFGEFCVLDGREEGREGETGENRYQCYLPVHSTLFSSFFSRGECEFCMVRL